MPETLLRTKLFVPPLRPNLVPRPQLTQRLNQARQLGHKLTLVSAPAGFGKTTLVSEWVATVLPDAAENDQTENRVAWLSLDNRDNDLERFLAYLVAALRRTQGIETTVGEEALKLLDTPQPSLSEDVLTSLINDTTSIREGIILILDDYHLIESSQVDKALTFLLEHLPSQIHLVIVTREDPNLPLARFRGRGQLTELRAAELRFTSIEAAEFLNQVVGLDLSVEDIAALEARTEGWIAGLQLASLALQGTISIQGRPDVTNLIQSFTGTHRLVLDYLVEEVLNQQPQHVQQFLLQTAVLDQLTGPLCDALTGQENGGATLEMLERANLFIVSLDEEQRWYRYHHLFGDLLRRRLRQSLPDGVAGLHVRASGWLERNGLVTEAVDHALIAKDYDRATRLIRHNAMDLFQRGELLALLDWINLLPDQSARSQPWQSIHQAWVLTIWMFTSSGRLDDVEPLLEDVARSLNSEDVRIKSPIEAQEMFGNIAVMRAFVAVLTDEFSRAIELAMLAEETLTEQSLWALSVCHWTLGSVYRVRGDLGAASQAFAEVVKLGKAMDNIWTTVVGMTDLAEIRLEQGQLHQSAALYREMLRIAADPSPRNRSDIGPVDAGLARVLYAQNDLTAAHRLATEATNRTGSSNQHVFAHDILARVLFAQGDIEGASNALRKADQMMGEYSVMSWLVDAVEQTRVRMMLAQGDMTTVERWQKEHQEESVIDKGPLAISLARIYIALGRTDEALRLLNRLEQNATSEKRINMLIETLVLQSLALQTKKGVTFALEKLENCLALAEPEGYVRVFVDEGPPMARLLHETVSRGIVPDYARRLLAAFAVAESEQVSPRKTPLPKSDLVEPLSEREIEVLQIIAEGLTNPEIASRLYISLNTVKVHTRNIYGKLDAHNRTQAVAKARDLGILPPF